MSKHIWIFNNENKNMNSKKTFLINIIILFSITIMLYYIWIIKSKNVMTTNKSNAIAYLHLPIRATIIWN
jgi:flagellar basal body-associated protein FliL